MSMLSQAGIVVGSAGLSLACYFGGAAFASKFLPEDPDGDQKSLAIMGGGAVIGNLAGKVLREYARQNCSSQNLKATCYGTFIGSLLPMLVCIGGFDKKESKTTQMIATASIVATLSIHLAALSNPQDESIMKFATGMIFGVIPPL